MDEGEATAWKEKETIQDVGRLQRQWSGEVTAAQDEAPVRVCPLRRPRLMLRELAAGAGWKREEKTMYNRKEREREGETKRNDRARGRGDAPAALITAAAAAVMGGDAAGNSRRRVSVTLTLRLRLRLRLRRLRSIGGLCCICQLLQLSVLARIILGCVASTGAVLRVGLRAQSEMSCGRWPTSESSTHTKSIRSKGERAAMGWKSGGARQQQLHSG